MHMMADGDRDTFDRLVAPEATNRESRTEPPAARVPGPDGLYATALWLREAFGDFHHEVVHAVEEDDVVVLDTVMTARHVGPFVTYDERGRVDQVFAPTGKSFAVHQTHWLRIADGKLVEHWADRDDLGMARQAGWVPPTPAGLIRNALAKRKVRKGTAHSA
ncbi:ester cyclase [Rhodococcus sp. O3]|uniref:ester cyclase n=1 Tax=Rhodococcus sp. O3 TaxID=3404919 RepID=UPI003B67EEFD